MQRTRSAGDNGAEAPSASPAPVAAPKPLPSWIPLLIFAGLMVTVQVVLVRQEAPPPWRRRRSPSRC